MRSNWWWRSRAAGATTRSRRSRAAFSATAAASDPPPPPRRDLQIASRDMKRPWEIGKAFDHSAPCGPLQPAAKIGHPSKGYIRLKCNGKVRQDGDLAQMIWKVPEVIEKLSEQVEL